VYIDTITLTNAPSWAIHAITSSEVFITDVTVTSVNIDSSSSDGIVIDSTKNATVDQCTFAVAGMPVAVRSGTARSAPPSTEITVTRLTSQKGIGVGTGPANGGGISNVTFNQLQFEKSEIAINVLATAGLGEITNISFSNVVMSELSNMAISFWVFPSDKSGPSPIIHNVSISDIKSTTLGAYQGGNFHCLTSASCDKISLKNIDIWCVYGFYCSAVSGTASNVYPASCLSTKEESKMDK